MARTLDFYNVQGYDFHGTWETSTNHASPLFDSPQDPAHADNFNIDYTISAYLQAGGRLKAIYVNRGGLGGAFVWAVKDDDGNGTLVKTMADGLSRH